jgi:hypothetical protein
VGWGVVSRCQRKNYNIIYDFYVFWYDCYMGLDFKNKKIIFYPKSEKVKQVIPCPQTISVPKWFKEIPIYQKTEKYPFNDKLVVENAQVNYSSKSCIPFLDSLTTGYSFNLWCDIQIKTINGVPRISWANMDEDLSPVNGRPEPDGHPVPNGFYPLIFSWYSTWGIKTPKGYSCILTHPFNRTDLPFLTTTAIMDTDGWGLWGNQPFHLQKDFEGIIEAGTPIIHVYPFKRDNWVSEIDDSLTEWANYEDIRRSSKFRGYYKNKYWSKKSFK